MSGTPKDRTGAERQRRRRQRAKLYGHGGYRIFSHPLSEEAIAILAVKFDVVGEALDNPEALASAITEVFEEWAGVA